MKVVIVGATSQSTPYLFKFLADERAGPDLDFVLAGRDRTRLLQVTRAATILLRGALTQVEFAGVQSDDFETALEGADVVLLQIRVGGLTSRHFDETFPLKYGVCGDEALGLGGLSAAWRAWPVIKSLLSRVSAVAPEALLILLSSPVGILVRAINASFPQLRTVGICELPWTTLLDVCEVLNVNSEEVEFEYLGVNHLGWFYHLASGRRNLLEEYRRRRGQSNDFPSADLIERCSGIPTKFLNLHYNHTEVLKEQQARREPRAQVLYELSRSAFTAFQNGDREEILCALRERLPRWYSHAVGPLILGLTGRKTTGPLYLSVRNAGYYPPLQEDDVLEIPHVIRTGRLERVERSRPVPAHIADLMNEFVSYERLAARAVTNREPSLLNEALSRHPWTRDNPHINQMVLELTTSDTLRH